MDRPSPQDVRDVLANLREAAATVDATDTSQLPDGVPAARVEAYEAAARAATRAERQLRDQLASMIEAIAGPRPCAVSIDGTVIALADDGDGMAVIPAGQVVHL